MDRIEIKKIFENPAEYADKKITVYGWVRTIRDSKAIGFAEINDGSCFKGLQVVFEAEKVENYKDIAKLNVGAAIKVTGTLLLTPNAGQPFEINADEIAVEVGIAGAGEFCLGVNGADGFHEILPCGEPCGIIDIPAAAVAVGLIEDIVDTVTGETRFHAFCGHVRQLGFIEVVVGLGGEGRLLIVPACLDIRAADLDPLTAGL